MRDRPAVLVALVLIAGGLIAFVLLRNDDGSSEGATPLVPNVVGLQEAAARVALVDRGFLVDSERESGSADPGVVLEQSPSAGSPLSEGSRVRITISTGPEQTETETETTTQTGPTQTQTQTTTTTTTEPPGLRNVIGIDYRKALRQLLSDGLLPDTRPAESPHRRGLVVGQRPAVGTALVRSSSVSLSVSLGPRALERVAVPDLTRLPLPDAIRQCAAAGFTCQTIGPRNHAAIVGGQRPLAGRSLSQLGQITLSTQRR